MATPSLAAPASSRDAAHAFLPLLLILFFCSGCSALIYEIVWFQLLQFAIGSSAVSIAVLLGTFMGGMCLGSLAFGRLVSRRRHPLRTYAVLELCIGLLGILISAGMPLFDRFYASLAHAAGAGLTMRALVCVICLLPPTFLMGATLPAISRWIKNTPRGAAWLGFFYGGNTVGAVAGSLLAGFYLLRHFDMFTATYVAAALNLFVAIAGILLSFAAPYDAPPDPAAGVSDAAAIATPPFEESAIYLAIAISGASALGGEVIWTRLLALLFGGTIYTFSIILAVFLVGLGAGSSVGAVIARSTPSPRKALAWCQILCILAIAWSAWATTNGLPNWPANPYLDTGLRARFELDLARCAWAIAPPAIFWGASFPLALAAVIAARPRRDPARSVGRVYAANTLGAIAGSVFFALFSIAHWGSTASQHILIALAAAAGIIALLPGLLPVAGRPRSEAPRGLLGTTIALVCAILLGSSTLITLHVSQADQLPWQLVAWGRRFRAWTIDLPNEDINNGDTRLLYMGEGLNSSVAVTTSGADVRNFHVAGKIEASTDPQDMRLQLMLGHYPALFHPDADKKKKVLIVGCGAGVTAGTFILHPDFEKIVLCEIEPLVPKVVAQYFSEQNNSVVTRIDSGPHAGEFVDPRVTLINDDARHYILTTGEKYDVITSDPIHPWVKGAATLYSREYFELVKQHLNPGGLVTQWVPLYESNMAVVKSEIKTFFDAFPNGTIWLNDQNGAGYDVILLGSVEPLKIDARDLQSRMNLLISGVLGDVKLGTPADILKTYGGRARDLTDWTLGGEINTDRSLRLQYLAGEALNDDQATEIQNQILRHRQYPDDLLKAPADIEKSLREAWGDKGP